MPLRMDYAKSYDKLLDEEPNEVIQIFEHAMGGLAGRERLCKTQPPDLDHAALSTPSQDTQGMWAPVRSRIGDLTGAHSYLLL